MRFLFVAPSAPVVRYFAAAGSEGPLIGGGDGGANRLTITTIAIVSTRSTQAAIRAFRRSLRG
jgi:hypothetical protein